MNQTWIFETENYHYVHGVKTSDKSHLDEGGRIISRLDAFTLVFFGTEDEATNENARRAKAFHHREHRLVISKPVMAYDDKRDTARKSAASGKQKLWVFQTDVDTFADNRRDVLFLSSDGTLVSRNEALQRRWVGTNEEAYAENARRVRAVSNCPSQRHVTSKAVLAENAELWSADVEAWHSSRGLLKGLAEFNLTTDAHFAASGIAYEGIKAGYHVFDCKQVNYDEALGKLFVISEYCLYHGLSVQDVVKVEVEWEGDKIVSTKVHIKAQTYKPKFTITGILKAPVK